MYVLLSYSQDVRVVRFEQHSNNLALLDALSATELPPHLKALLPPAQAAFEAMDTAMDSEYHIEHIKSPKV